MKNIWCALIMLTAALAMAGSHSAVAQPEAAAATPPPGEQAGPGAQNASGGHDKELFNVYAWQAMAVAKMLSLPDDTAKKLSAAYEAAQEHRHATERAESEKEHGQLAEQTRRAILNAERVQFKTALQAFLNPDQTFKTMIALGGFDPRWSRMVFALENLKLDDQTKAAAVLVVTDYAVEYDSITTSSSPAWLDQVKELKKKRDAKLSKLLSADQLFKWDLEYGGRRSLYEQFSKFKARPVTR